MLPPPPRGGLVARTDGNESAYTASRAPGPGGVLPGPARSLSPAGAGRSSRGRGVLTRDRPDGANTVRKHGRDPAAGTLQPGVPPPLPAQRVGGGRLAAGRRDRTRALHAADERPRGGTDGRARAGRRRAVGPTGSHGAEESSASSRASAGRESAGRCREGPFVSLPPVRPGLRRFSSPGTGGPRPARRLGARGRNRPNPAERRPTLQARARLLSEVGRALFGPPSGGTTDRSRKQERERLRARAPPDGSSPRA